MIARIKDPQNHNHHNNSEKIGFYNPWTVCASLRKPYYRSLTQKMGPMGTCFRYSFVFLQRADPLTLHIITQAFKCVDH